MVAIAFAVAAPTLGLAGAGIGTGAAIAGIAIGLLAAYVDSTVVYPGLFGKKSGSKPDSLEGFQISTTDPGAPRWDVYGTRAWVPCHYLWTLGVREETSGGGGGKGGRPLVAHVRADVGLALCDGPVKDTVDLYADERVFWSKQFNRVVLEDHRWTITAGTGGEAGYLVIQATDSETADFAGIFEAGDVTGNLVRLERVSPGSITGFYRVVGVSPHSGTTKSRVVLKPLRGQSPAAGVAGSIFEPAALRRIDQGVASSEWIVYGAPQPQLMLLRPDPTDPGPTAPNTIPGLPFQSLAVLQRVWIPGGIYRLDGFTPSALNGRYRLVQWNMYHAVDTSTMTPTFGDWRFLPIEGQSLSGTLAPGTPTQPGIIYRDESGGFVFFDSQQDWQEYRGTADQPSDPTLALYEDDPPAHRGIAHLSLTNWTLAPFGNILPRVTGMVRARSGETVGAAISRICGKTAPTEHIDVSSLRGKVCLGYSVAGGTAPIQAIQPLLTFYGIAVQDRGGVLTFLDERDLPVVPVATRHLNARATTDRTTTRGFVASRIDPFDVPERVLVQYLDPAEGANEAEGDGRRAPGDPDRGSGDTMDVNLKPLVVWPYDAKRRAREIRRRISLETYRGQVRLGPGYMDVLPGHCITFASNDEEFDAAPASATIAYDTRLRDLLPGSVAVRVRFVGGQVATLLDNGSGALEGFPAGITTSINTVDYDAGRIELLASEALDTSFPPQITYRYDRQWLMRANKATLGGYDFGVTCECLSTTTDEPLPPVPRRISSGLGAPIVSAVPPYRSLVLDIPALQAGMSTAVWVGFVSAPEPGAPWRGATIYQSPNGIDRWTAVAQITASTIMGTAAGSALPSRFAGATPGTIDWSTELEVDIPNGELLETWTTDMIGYGLNWALVGNEIIAFHEAEAQEGTRWILRGLWRGRRHTDGAMNLHVDGERFVLLTGMGQTHGVHHEIAGGYAAANRTYHWRVVPGGASVTAVDTITTTMRGESARPPAPLLTDGDVTQKIGSYVGITWWRRSREMPSLFGPAPLPNGWVEKYELVAFDAVPASSLAAAIGIEAAIQATTVRRWLVGDELMGTQYVGERRVEYYETDITADGFTLGSSLIGFAVYAIGPAGKSEASDFVVFMPAT